MGKEIVSAGTETISVGKEIISARGITCRICAARPHAVGSTPLAASTAARITDRSSSEARGDAALAADAVVLDVAAAPSSVAFSASASALLLSEAAAVASPPEAGLPR